MLQRTSLALLTALLLWTAPAWATLTIGTSVTVESGAATALTEEAPAIAVTSDQFLFACTKWESNTTLTGFSDTAGNTYTLGTTQQHTGNEPSGRCGWVISPAVHAANKVLATYSGLSAYRAVTVYTVNKNSGTVTLDVESANSTEDTADATPSSAVVTTTGTDEICFAHHADYTGQSFDTETIDSVAKDGRVTQGDTDVFYRILTATMTTKAASLNRSATGASARWVQRLTCFKATGGGSPAPPVIATRYVDNTPPVGCTNGITTYNPSTEACGAGSSTLYTTIAAATAAMASGEILAIRTGTYLEDLRDRLPAGTLNTPTIVQAYGSVGAYEVVTIRPSTGRVLYITGDSYITIRGLILDGVNGTTFGDDVIKLEDGSNNFVIEDSTFKNGGGNGLLVNTTSNGVVRRCTITGNGRYSTTSPALHGIYMAHGTNWLLEYNDVHDNYDYGFQIYPGSINALIRYNNIHENGVNSSNSNGEVVLASSGHIFEHNTVWGHRTTNGLAVQFYSTAVDVTVRHNTVYHTGTTYPGIYVASGALRSVIQNNHVAGAATNLTNLGTSTTLTTNRTTGGAALTDCTVSTSNFTQKVGSSCINAGTALTGVAFNTYTGKTKPDQGAFETFSYGNASINAAVLDVFLGMNLNTPVLPATGQTTYTVACSGSNCGTPVVASAAKLTGTDSVVRLTLTGLGGSAVCEAGQTWTVSYVASNVTDSSLMGNATNQPMTAFTTKAVTNLCGGAAPAWRLDQVGHQFYEAIYAGTSTTPLSAINAANTNVPSGTKFALVTQTDCTVADCPSIGQKAYFSRIPIATGTPSAFAVVTDDCTTDLICFMGATSDPTYLTGAVTCCLSGALTPLNGVTQFTSAAIPVFDLPTNGSTVQRRMLQLSPFAPVGDIFLFEEKIQTGVAFTSYTPSGGSKLTVSPTGSALSAPTGLHEVGAASNTLIELVWTPISGSVGFAGYRVYQSSTLGGAGTLVATITTASAAATHSTTTTFRTAVSQAGVYYFTVTQFDTGGEESARSSEVAVTRTGQVARTTR